MPIKTSNVLVTLRHVRIIILAKKGIKQYVLWVCVCTLNYSVSNNPATCYIVVDGLSIGTKLYTFSYHLYQFQKRLLNIKCLFCVVLQIWYEISYFKNNSDRYYHTCTVHRSLCKIPFFLSDFNNCWIFLVYLSKILETNFMKTRPVTEYLFHVDTQTDGWTDRHNDANCPFSDFCERA